MNDASELNIGDPAQRDRLQNPFGGVTFGGFNATTFAIPSHVPIKEAMTHLLDANKDFFVYQRIEHPYSWMLEQFFQNFTPAKHALVWTSGMDSIDVAILNFMAHCIPKGFNHIVASDDLYGGIYDLLKNFYPIFGIKTTFVDVTNPLNIARAIGPKTAMFYGESLSNPQQKVVPYKALADIKHWTRDKFNPEFTITLDTTLTPMSGGMALRDVADVVIIATTKYENGHSDSLGGVLLTNETHLHEHLWQGRKRHSAMTPDQCITTARGLETINLRVPAQEQSALKIANFLTGNPAVKKIIYAGLESHPQYNLTARQFAHVGSVVSFVLKGDYGALERFRSSLERKPGSNSPWVFGVSLGGTHSLFEFPHFMTHGSLSSEAKTRLGIVPNFVRLAVGIEPERFLLEALSEALRASQKNA